MRNLVALFIILAVGQLHDLLNAQVLTGKDRSGTLAPEIEYTLSEATKQFLFGNLNGSKFLFQKCIENDDHCAVAYYMLSGLESLDGNVELAKSYAIRAHGLDRKNRYYSENLANILLLANSKKEALEIIRDLNEKSPSPELIIRMARLEDELGSYKRAIKDLERFNQPVNELISQEIIRISKKNGDIKYVYKFLAVLVKAFPENIGFAGDLALISAGMKQYVMADSVFSRYCFSKEVPEEFIFHAVRFYLYFGRKSMADSICREYEETLNSSAERKFKRASLWVLDKVIMENYRDYVEVLIDNGLKEGSRSEPWINLKAQLLVNDGREDTAIEFLKVKIDSGFHNLEIFGKLLFLLNSKGDSSLELYGRYAVKFYPEQVGFQILYSVGLMVNGNYREMITELEELVNEDLDAANKVRALVFLGEGYRKLGRNSLSDAAFDSALAINPSNDLLLNNYSYYLSERSEKLEKADKMSKALMEINKTNATYLDTRGWVLFKLGKVGKARKYLERAMNAGGLTNAVIIKHLGDVMYYSGKEDKAMEYWKKSADLEGKQFSMEEQMDRMNRENYKMNK
ncbi:MAG: hypothetical protein U0T82_05280 [Bacteroidales bacterium]